MMSSNHSSPQKWGCSSGAVLAIANPPIYRNVDVQDSPLLRSRGTLKFEYEIASSFERFHSNPPLWEDIHSHIFEVRLIFESRQNPGDLYGLDMIEMQEKLEALISRIPPTVNKMPGCESGTTEALCSFFAEIRLLIEDSLIKLIKISVSETSDRVTTLLLQD